VGRERAGRFPFVHVGLDLPLEQVAERLAEELVLVALDHRGTISPAFFCAFGPSVGPPLHCPPVTDVLVGVAHDGGIRTLPLDSPANRNALSSALLAQLEQALRDATSDPEVRAVVLTGTGTVFCSGADLAERGAGGLSRMPAILTSVVESAVPIIVRVNGHARAGGLGLIAAADMAVASEAATFAFTEVRVGVAPAMILVPALRVVDRRFLARAALTGERFGASEAAAAGLLTAVTPDEAGRDEWVAERTTALRQAAPGAVRATKALLRTLPAQGWTKGLAAATATSTELFAGAEAAEGMDAFLQKRRPAWDTTT
jgi:enoyl-CoA hydratase/carnithine racemase